MRYLITGGAGFIGSALARMLAAKSEGVVVIDKLTYAADIRALDPIKESGKPFFEQIDICDAQAVSGILSRHSPLVVFHLAAESNVDRPAF